MDLHDALFWTAENNHVDCHLCPNNCKLKDGQTGPCNTRINKENKLYTLAYNNPSAIQVDPVEKKPLYHFMPGHSTFSLATNGCILHCVQCQNSSISQCEPTQKSSEAYSPEAIIKLAKKHHCESISLTYTDPIAFFEYSYDICREAQQNDIPVTLISSGYINPEPLKLISPLISAANIDIKSFNENSYKLFFKGKLAPVLDSVLYLKKQNIWLEITVLLIPGINDSSKEITALCEWMDQNSLNDVPLHFSRFHPSHKLLSKSLTPLTSLEAAKSIAQEHHIIYCYIGNAENKDYHSTHCPNCGKVLIERHRLSLSYIYMQNGKCPECQTHIAGIW
ncbi:AmmeMemoRadiSam system radical SAM enzyme [Saccharicrinis sp. FJH54]|uniref:AmmeMemoRadiSam system radical SAM enzyme n=1 Tax=Saccharicrinis sp. FJH54 TaxID=3344665 RepID=UPI0035D47D04